VRSERNPEFARTGSNGVTNAIAIGEDFDFGAGKDPSDADRRAERCDGPIDSERQRFSHNVQRIGEKVGSKPISHGDSLMDIRLA
jgi:hypothetical protein